MRMLWAVVVGALGWAGFAAEVETRRADEKLLESAQVATEGKALLEFFRQRTRGPADQTRIKAWIQRLGNEDFAEREKASRSLIAQGVSAVQDLKEAVKSGDAEISSRATKCLEAMPTGVLEDDHVAAAARVLARRKPAGAFEVLLAFLADARDERLQEDILALLPSLVEADTRRQLAVLVKDAQGIRRRAAALCLAASPIPAERRLVHPLLDDADGLVRWQAAHALVLAGDTHAVSALPHLVHDGPPVLALRADELLRRIGGAPAFTLDSTQPDSRRLCRDQWQRWWRTNQDRIDLAQLKPTLGLTAIAECNGDNVGRIWECAADGMPRWHIKARNPVALEMLPEGRFLVADSLIDGRVAECDPEGKILWSKALNWPVSCQRLANGNTFLATMTDLLEVTRGGRTVYSFRRPNYIFAARKLANDHIVFLHSKDGLLEIDAAGKLVRLLPVDGISSWGNLDVLANGHFLLALYSANRVVEIDGDGKVLWTCEVATPSWVCQLPTGNILVASADDRRVLEFDRTGKKVWEQATQGRPFCARRR